MSIFSKPTYSHLLSLYDNYNFETGVAESETQQERTEIDAFLNSVMDSKPFEVLKNFLRKKDHPIAKNDTLLRQWIRQIWFGLYSRARGQADTSGFEHVFIGEAKNGEIAGMHNWARFYYLEKRESAKFDYKGFLVRRKNIFAALKYSYNGFIKRGGSFLIGSSPEFDMAIYTLCFLSRRGSNTCDFEIDGCAISITSFDLVQNGKVYIGTMYPNAGRLTEACRQNY